MAYEVIISGDVLKMLDSIVFYLENNWSKKIAKKFLINFYAKVDALVSNPAINPKSSKSTSIWKMLITKHNMLYYEVHDNTIELLQLFDTRQSPAKNKFE